MSRVYSPSVIFTRECRGVEGLGVTPCVDFERCLRQPFCLRKVVFEVRRNAGDHVHDVARPPQWRQVERKVLASWRGLVADPAEGFCGDFPGRSTRCGLRLKIGARWATRLNDRIVPAGFPAAV